MTSIQKKSSLKLLSKENKPRSRQVTNRRVMGAKIGRVTLGEITNIVPHQNEKNPRTRTQRKARSASERFSYNEFTTFNEGETDQLSCYSNHIYYYLKTQENKFQKRENFLEGTVVTGTMRETLIDWLFESMTYLRAKPSTKQLAIAILDRFIQTHKLLSKSRLKVAVLGSAMLAMKYEERSLFVIEDLEFFNDSLCSKSELLWMEHLILKTLDFQMNFPIPIAFLGRLSQVARVSLPETHLAYYLTDLALSNYKLCTLKPSVLACLGLYFAMALHSSTSDANPFLWTPTLEHYTKIKYSDFAPHLPQLSAILININSSQFQAIPNFYRQSKYHYVSLHPRLSAMGFLQKFL